MCGIDKRHQGKPLFTDAHAGPFLGTSDTVARGGQGEEQFQLFVWN